LTTAARLLRRFDTLENILSDTIKIGTMKMRGAVRVQRLIKAHRDTLRLAQRLTRIDCTARLPDPLLLTRRRADTAQLDAIFDKLTYWARTRCYSIATAAGDAAM
jgi:DNA polymerase-1